MVLWSKCSTELERGPSCQLWTDPSPVPNPRSGIFRTIGESTAGKHLDSVIRNIFKSNNQEDPVASFKERKNTMVATASTVARRLVQEHRSV